MTDNKSPQARRRNMAAVRSENTRPEILVRRTLFSLGFRFRLHRKDLVRETGEAHVKGRNVLFADFRDVTRNFRGRRKIGAVRCLCVRIPFGYEDGFMSSESAFKTQPDAADPCKKVNKTNGAASCSGLFQKAATTQPRYQKRRSF